MVEKRTPPAAIRFVMGLRYFTLDDWIAVGFVLVLTACAVISAALIVTVML